MTHRFKNPYLLPVALNDTLKWIDNELTLIALPRAGHFVHRDAAPVVTERMVEWLTRKE